MFLLQPNAGVMNSILAVYIWCQYLPPVFPILCVVNLSPTLCPLNKLTPHTVGLHTCTVTHGKHVSM